MSDLNYHGPLSKNILIYVQLTNATVLQHENLTLNFINLSSIIFPYIIAIFGTLSNVILVIAYLTRKNKFIDKYYMPIYCVTNQVAISVFVISNIYTDLDRKSSLMEYSKYSCKLLSFVFSISTTLINWIHALVPFLLKCQVNRSVETMEKTRLFLFVLPIVFTCIYSMDLVYLKLMFDQNGSIHCALTSLRVTIIKDLLDTLFYLILPTAIIIYSIRNLNKRDKVFKSLLITRILFICVWSLISIVPLVNDYRIMSKNILHKEYTLLIESIFTVAIILNRSLPILAICSHAMLNRHTRLTFYKIVCFVCYREDTDHLEFQVSFFRSKHAFIEKINTKQKIIEENF